MGGLSFSDSDKLSDEIAEYLTNQYQIEEIIE
jgi:hypothetical protein